MFTGQFHEGKGISIHMTIVSRKVILVVLFDKNKTHGLVRLRVKKACQSLEKILEEVNKKAASPREDVFAEITDADIDNLFNDCSVRNALRVAQRTYMRPSVPR